MTGAYYGVLYIMDFFNSIIPAIAVYFVEIQCHYTIFRFSFVLQTVTACNYAHLIIPAIIINISLLQSILIKCSTITFWSLSVLRTSTKCNYHRAIYCCHHFISQCIFAAICICLFLQLGFLKFEYFNLASLRLALFSSCILFYRFVNGFYIVIYSVHSIHLFDDHYLLQIRVIVLLFLLYWFEIQFSYSSYSYSRKVWTGNLAPWSQPGIELIYIDKSGPRVRHCIKHKIQYVPI